MVILIILVGVIVGLTIGMVSFCMTARKGDNIMATLWEIEHDWGYDDDEPIEADDDPLEEDDMITSFYPKPNEKKRKCTIYTYCDDCKRLQYATGKRWYTNPDLCMCLPF